LNFNTTGVCFCLIPLSKRTSAGKARREGKKKRVSYKTMSERKPEEEEEEVVKVFN